MRNVAEYAYCPRLFYYMQVEGIFIPNADTEKGNSAHRKVNKPSREKNDNNETPQTDPDKPVSVRSLALSDKDLGITATLDLAEITGSTAIPVEYRKGRPRRISIDPPPEEPDEADELPVATPEPWPTDLVQIGLQAILLERAGYKVTEAILYYAAEKLRLKINVDEALKSNALKTLEEAKKCAQGERPMPLVNDKRCLRCSLQPVCLPDEINYERLNGELTPRKIWPPQDEGIHVVAQDAGAKIGVSGMYMVVTNRDGVKVRETPLVNVETLSILGPVQITTQAINALSEKGIPIAFLSSAGRLISMIDPLDSVSAAVRKAQVRQFDRPEICLTLTRALITAKILNQRTILLRNIKSDQANIGEQLLDISKQVSNAASIEEIRGLEGAAASIYFNNFGNTFKNDIGKIFAENGRQRRPPPDPVNSCLSMAYTMLTHECVTALRLARLEPSIGAFHSPKPGRPALALDLMEPFRPLIADSIAISSFNKGELVSEHFIKTSAGCMFTDAGRKAFFKAYGRRMNTVIMHPVFEYRLSYRRMIMLHARMVAAWLMNEIPTLSFLTTK